MTAPQGPNVVLSSKIILSATDKFGVSELTELMPGAIGFVLPRFRENHTYVIHISYPNLVPNLFLNWGFFCWMYWSSDKSAMAVEHSERFAHRTGTRVWSYRVPDKRYPGTRYRVNFFSRFTGLLTRRPEIGLKKEKKRATLLDLVSPFSSSFKVESCTDLSHFDTKICTRN